MYGIIPSVGLGIEDNYPEKFQDHYLYTPESSDIKLRCMWFYIHTTQNYVKLLVTESFKTDGFKLGN